MFLVFVRGLDGRAGKKEKGTMIVRRRMREKQSESGEVETTKQKGTCKTEQGLENYVIPGNSLYLATVLSEFSFVIIF